MARGQQVEAVLELLEKARERLAASELGPAFDALLDAWRMIRAVEIAELCELLSRRAARNQPPLTVDETKKQTERLIDWMNFFRARTALGVGVLIADVERAFAANLAPRFLFPRIEALASLKDDPRTASLMVRTAARIQDGGSWNKFVPQYVKAFHMARDPGFVAQLDDAIAANPSARVLTRGAPLSTGSKALRTLRAEMQHGPPALPPELAKVALAIRAQIEAIAPDLVVPLARARASEGDPVALLEEVRRDPDDYELRLVLADALMNIGDPLGEFIVLQSRRANNDDVEERSRSLSRERALLTEHLKTWIGPLASVVQVGSAVFERGFLTKCKAVAGKRVTAEVHFQHVEWATLRSITFSGQARITPQMRALREAIGVDYTGLLQLASTGHPKLERINLNGTAVWPTPIVGTQQPNEALRLFANCDPEKLPAFTHLEISTMAKAATDWIWTAKWRRQLRSIGVSSNSPAVAQWVAELRRRDHLEEVCFFRDDDHRVTIRTKENDGDHLTLIVELFSLPYFFERSLISTLVSIQDARLRFKKVQIAEETDLQLTHAQRERLNQLLDPLRR
jgi:uncharacterized protein (TIGR02996 family)